MAGLIPPRVDSARLLASINEFAQIGGTRNGGVTRLALSKEDCRARRLLIDHCSSAGCSIRIDRLGNIFARRDGIRPEARSVLIGSHLDTQPFGGRYDGAYGVLAGLEVIRTLNDLGMYTSRSIELAVWTNEEGCRFPPSMMGSAWAVGDADIESILATTDPNGISFAGALESSGLYADLRVSPERFYAYLELHIEQGPVLESLNCPIGVVTGANGQAWFDVNIKGFQAHAGTTPMTRRRDALATAARLVLAVERDARECGDSAVATVGQITCAPNARNTIPGEVDLTVDIRNPDLSMLIRQSDRLLQLCASTSESDNVSISHHCRLWQPPIQFSREIASVIEAASSSAGYASHRMISGAGHDACNLARHVATAMIFVPCRHGISHNEAENVLDEHVAAGANVLLLSTLELAEDCL